MHLYKKIIKPKNTAAKITTFSCVAAGAFLWIMSAYIPIPSIPQTVSVIFIAAAIYIASAYLIREYSFEIANNYKENETEAKMLYDLIINERKGNKFIKVCHIEFSDIVSVREVNPTNVKQVKAERDNKKRYTYNTQYAASQKIEVVADLGDEMISILITYDSELLSAMENILSNKLY